MFLIQRRISKMFLNIVIHFIVEEIFYFFPTYTRLFSDMNLNYNIVTILVQTDYKLQPNSKKIKQLMVNKKKWHMIDAYINNTMFLQG